MDIAPEIQSMVGWFFAVCMAVGFVVAAAYIVENMLNEYPEIDENRPE
jgi:hypothetical protein